MLPVEFHFLRPGWLLLLPVAVALLLWAVRGRLDRRRWEEVCDPGLVPHVLIDRAPVRQRRWPLILMALVATLGVLALAGPVWERIPQPVFRSESALVIALDLSQSMQVEDLAPSRSQRARFELRDILASREDGQTGLLVFAADAFVVSPLTDDRDTILAQVPALEPEIMPTQGSRPDRAIERAAALMAQAGVTRGDILLITDGAADVAAAVEAAETAADAGYAVSVLAVGTPEGGPVPGAGDGFLTDEGGGIVIARVDAGSLGQIASAGGGLFQFASAGDAELTMLRARWENADSSGTATGLETDVWLDRGPWLLAMAVPFVLLGFRRGVLGLAVGAFLFSPVPEASAAQWEDLWSRPDQRAAEALAEGDAETAQSLFEDRRWKAAAAYRAGDYPAAAAALDGLDDANSLYNRGNALAQGKELEEAIASYDRVLEQQPDHEDARYNRDLLQKLLDQQQAQSGQDGSSDDSQGGEQGEGQPGEGQPGQDGPDDEPSEQEEDGGAGQRDGGQPSGGQSSEADSQSAGDQGAPDEISEAERSALNEQAAASAQRDEEAGAGEAAQAGDPGAQRPDGQDGAATGADEEAQPDGEDGSAMAARSEPLDESEQATEQWLRRIPDDPGGLLRRKFYYQYRERAPASVPAEEEQAW